MVGWSLCGPRWRDIPVGVPDFEVPAVTDGPTGSGSVPGDPPASSRVLGVCNGLGGVLEAHQGPAVSPEVNWCQGGFLGFSNCVIKRGPSGFGGLGSAGWFLAVVLGGQPMEG